MSENDLYEEFIHRYLETGAKEIPKAWPPEVQERCLFFLRLLEDSRESRGTDSVLVPLKETEIHAELDLPDPQGPPVPPGASKERYAIERQLAQGGMGRVLLAFDRDLRRRIAMKVMGAGIRGGRLVSRFLEEAQATAQLEHPNIAPVYDLGLDPSGRPFFTMKWVRGRDLKEIIASQPGDFSLTRLVQILQQVAMGVHYANTRGVVHRDLKPRNIMVGEYGEVLVVDWGLARILHQPWEKLRGAELSGEQPVSTERAEGGVGTLDGAVQGSVAYMSPEQARGEVNAIDCRTDVFGLGAILYEILTGSPPYPEQDIEAALARARRGEIVPPTERAPGRTIPAELDAACRKALRAGKEDRFQNAREFHDALQSYIEGIQDRERRAAEAGRLCAAAQALLGELRRSEARAAQLGSQEKELRAALRDHDPEEGKGRAWEVMAEKRAAREEVGLAFQRCTSAYLAVLNVEPENRVARGALADLFFERMQGAEAQGDREATALYENLVRQYHDGRYQLALQGTGLLRLRSQPPGAAAEVSRYEERGPLLVESAWRRLGETPLECSLPHGSYLVILRKPGCREVRYPFLLERSGVHEAEITLYPPERIPDGFVQVPGGPTIVGGDFSDSFSLERAKVHVGEFFAGRFPVTLGEYCDFLNDAYGTVPGDDPELRERLPFFGSEEYVVRQEGGRLAPIPQLSPRVPVMAVKPQAALSYCGWLGRRCRKEVRLLEEVEWERCARGADGRLYPWGNHFDWALCKGRRSRQGKPAPEPVGAFPRDVSVFGVRDLAGGVRELCAGWYGEGYRPCRGGSWFISYAGVFRCDSRTSEREGTRLTDVGFRVGYSEPR